MISKIHIGSNFLSWNNKLYCAEDETIFANDVEPYTKVSSGSFQTATYISIVILILKTLYCESS